MKKLPEGCSGCQYYVKKSGGWQVCTWKGPGDCKVQVPVLDQFDDELRRAEAMEKGVDR